MPPLTITRKRLGLTQAGLAVRLGIARETVVRYERGQLEPPAWYALALAGLEAERESSDADHT